METMTLEQLIELQKRIVADESAFPEELQVAVDLLRQPDAASVAASMDTIVGAPTPERSTEPVFLHDYKPRRESLIEKAMEKATPKKAWHHADVGPEVLEDTGPEALVDTRLEASADALPAAETCGDPEAGTAVRLEAQRDAPMSLPLEYYEDLKDNLLAQTDMKVVLFVAPTSGTGASTAAANFAALLAEDAGTKVLFIDADLRSAGRPQSSETNFPRKNAGVSLVQLLASNRSSVYPVPGPSNLYVLPGGTPCSLPLSLFQSEAFDRLLRTVRERFRYVVVDSPPLQGCPESLVLSRKTDGVVLVVESEKTRKRTALWAKQQIENAGGRLLGVVLNKRRSHIPGWLDKRI
jgi:protein-tyrosine kinase